MRRGRDLNKTTAECCAAAVNEFVEIYRLAVGAVREGMATPPDVVTGSGRFHSRTRCVFTAICASFRIGLAYTYYKCLSSRNPRNVI